MKKTNEVDQAAVTLAAEPEDAVKKRIAKIRQQQKAATYAKNEDGEFTQIPENKLMVEAFATTHAVLTVGLLDQASQAVPRRSEDKTDVHYLNFALQAMHALAPRDGLEAMLCTQLVGLQALGMRFLERAARPGQTDEGIETNVIRGNRCLRTFAQTAEVLRAYRSKGEQKVTVKHVHVYDGGQAIVGNVGRAKKPRGGGRKDGDE